MKIHSKKDWIVLSLTVFIMIITVIPLLLNTDFMVYVYTTPSGQISQWEYFIASVFILIAFLGCFPFIIVVFMWLTD